MGVCAGDPYDNHTDTLSFGHHTKDMPEMMRQKPFYILMMSLLVVLSSRNVQ